MQVFEYSLIPPGLVRQAPYVAKNRTRCVIIKSEMHTMRQRPRLIVAGTLLLAVVLCALIFHVPSSSGPRSGDAVQWRAASALAATIVTIGATVLFLSGLKNFKAELRRAYLLLAGGLTLFSLALLQLPIIGFFNQWSALWWVNSGLVVAPFVFATGLVYIGIRRFAILLGVRQLAMSRSFVFVVTLVATVVSYFAGHYFARYRATIGTGGYAAITVWSMMYIIFAVLLTRTILRRIGAAYKQAMRWLFVALCGIVAGGIQQCIVVFFMNNDYTYTAYGIQFIPFLATGLVLLRAGFTFSMLSWYMPGPVSDIGDTDTQDQDYIDSIVALAELASRPEAIDPILDKLRMVTSRLEPGTAIALDAPTKQRLLDAYRELEAYLLTDDPLRTFSVEELHTRLSPAFRSLIEK